MQELASALGGLAQAYHSWILWLGVSTGLSDQVLHIHAGMALLLAARLLTRRSLGSFVPIAFVLVAEAGNETLDRLASGSWEWRDTSSDIVNTVMWPLLICLVVRYGTSTAQTVRLRRHQAAQA